MKLQIHHDYEKNSKETLFAKHVWGNKQRKCCSDLFILFLVLFHKPCCKTGNCWSLNCSKVTIKVLNKLLAEIIQLFPVNILWRNYWGSQHKSNENGQDIYKE